MDAPHLYGKALDLWISAMPENEYTDFCPCGCGLRFRYAIRDGLEKHEATFIEKALAKFRTEMVTSSK
jgi:hypothetical protein